MDTSNQPSQKRPRSFSAEAMIGTGVTIAAIGVLCLLLGWAQAMRHVQPASGILLGMGAVLALIGGVIAMMAPKGKKGATPQASTAEDSVVHSSSR